MIADKASEDLIIEKLRDIHEDIRIISEETGEVIIGKKLETENIIASANRKIHESII